MARSTIHYAGKETNNILKRLHNKLRPAGTPVERVEYIIELLLLRIFETKLKRDDTFESLRKLFEGENYRLLFSFLLSLTGEQILSEFKRIFPFYGSILTKIRSVISTNLPTIIYDQLVLMEEVFTNSNFTNNVKGGVVAEVIGLINEIDEKTVLKTDLLGDAIESALSETGGTKDLGLFRTPDHIRKMMVEMIEPGFTDSIFDPACGTAGFLFDAYEYAIEKAKSTRQFPSENIANQFYRNGIGGIEYQGRIRKMAAVNLYIRGLNPHNIEQGDSLKMYDPAKDENSKSVIISNPPFGAERDQPSYPNIWEEYSKESETTILFVKLMFDLLKNGGRCAVVVSEGFLTWGQKSAIALRKILLNEANLRAIISLPQGVFVSKSGQGAKTSILYFEKGQPTDFVWYYKIENDGFSMGTNRKPKEGSQIPHMLKLFKEVKIGNRPNDTEYSFCIPKEWIEIIDPRLKARTEKEVRQKFIERIKTKKEKLIGELNKKITQEKINRSIYKQKLWQFDNVSESQIENEIAKAIEKAHDYHFNLQNYRSSLFKEQIKEWGKILSGVDPVNDFNIQNQFQELRSAGIAKGLKIIASLDPKSSLTVVIVKEYINDLIAEQVSQNKNDFNYTELMKNILKILEKDVKYPNIILKELIKPKYEKIKKEEYKGNLNIISKIAFNDGKIYFRELRETGMDLYKAVKGDLITSKINVHQGAIAICSEDLVCSTHYQIYEIDYSRVNPTYLVTLMRSSKFLKTLNLEKAGGIKNEVGAKHLLNFEIPFPPIEIQEEIVERIEKHKQIIEGVEKIIQNQEVNVDFSNYPRIQLNNIADKITQGPNPIYDNKVSRDYFVLKTKDLYNDIIYYKKAENISEKTYLQNKLHELQDDDLLIAIVGKGSIGKANIFKKQIGKKYIFTRALGLIRANEKKILPAFLQVYFLSSEGKRKINEGIEGTTGQLVLKTSYLKQMEVPFPTIDIQLKIVKSIDRQRQTIQDVKVLKTEAERDIETLLKTIWFEN